MIPPIDRLVFPLDFPESEKAIEFVELLQKHVGVFKVGLELFVQAGPEIIPKIRRAGGSRIFLDLKLHDIPTTVYRAMARIAALGVDFATVHACGSKEMLKSAVDGAGGRVKVLGVTVLTSEPEEKEGSVFELVMQRAENAYEAGCHGIVCSPLEAFEIKKRFGEDFFIITPGIRPGNGTSENDDQKRKATPGNAVKNGADFLVIGRPIRDAADPVKAAIQIEREIEQAFAL